MVDVSSWLPNLLGPLDLQVEGQPAGIPRRSIVNLHNLVATDDPTTQTTTIAALGGTGAFGQQPATLVNGANQNVALNGQATLRIVGPTGAFSIGGLSWGADSPAAGQVVWIINTTNEPITINHLDAGSLSANQITTPDEQSILLPPGNGAIHLVRDATSAKWVLIVAGIHLLRDFDIRWFGASTSASDNTAAIQAAINAAAAAATTSGGTADVVIPYGKWSCLSALVVPQHVRLKGVGWRSGVNAFGSTTWNTGVFGSILFFTGNTDGIQISDPTSGASYSGLRDLAIIAQSTGGMGSVGSAGVGLNMIGNVGAGGIAYDIHNILVGNFTTGQIENAEATAFHDVTIFGCILGWTTADIFSNSNSHYNLDIQGCTDGMKFQKETGNNWFFHTTLQANVNGITFVPDVGKIIGQTHFEGLYFEGNTGYNLKLDCTHQGFGHITISRGNFLNDGFSDLIQSAGAQGVVAFTLRNAWTATAFTPGFDRPLNIPATWQGTVVEDYGGPINDSGVGTTIIQDGNGLITTPKLRPSNNLNTSTAIIAPKSATLVERVVRLPDAFGNVPIQCAQQGITNGLTTAQLEQAFNALVQKLTVGGVLSPVNGIAFSPNDLKDAANSNMTFLWLDARAFAYLNAIYGFSLGFNFTPSRWPDLITNSDAVQNTAAHQPSLSTALAGINGIPVPIFAQGVNNQYMQTGLGQNQEFTMFAVTNACPNGRQRFIWSGVNASPNLVSCYVDSTDHLTLNGGSVLAAGGTIDTTTPHVITAVANGASSKLRVDGIQVAAGSANTQNVTGGFTIGAFFDGTSGWGGQIASVIGCIGAITDNQCEVIESWLKSVYGTP